MNHPKNESPTPATLGLIGAGHFARVMHLPNIRRSPNMRLKTVCDVRPEAIEAVRAVCPFESATSDVRELLADPEIEAVIITVREEAQAAIAVQALRAGKHVYVEKPLAKTTRQAEEVCAAQQASGKVAAVGFNRRFAPAMLATRDLVRLGGGVFNVYHRISDNGMRFAGAPGSRTEGTRVYYELCHCFDIFRWLTGSEIESVYCASSRPDDECFLMRTASGCVLTLLSTAYAGHGMSKERMEGMTRLGSFVMEEYCELRNYDIPGAPGRQTFAGHSTPGLEFGHKMLLEELGAEGMRAIRRTEAAALDRLLAAMHHPAQFPDLILDRESLIADLKETSGDLPELVDFVRMNLLGYGAYKYEKGWANALENFVLSIRGMAAEPNAGAVDGLRAQQIAAAAVQSRETGKVVKISY